MRLLRRAPRRRTACCGQHSVVTIVSVTGCWPLASCGSGRRGVAYRCRRVCMVASPGMPGKRFPCSALVAPVLPLGGAGSRAVSRI